MLRIQCLLFCVLPTQLVTNPQILHIDTGIVFAEFAQSVHAVQLTVGSFWDGFYRHLQKIFFMANATFSPLLTSTICHGKLQKISYSLSLPPKAS